MRFVRKYLGRRKVDSYYTGMTQVECDFSPGWQCADSGGSLFFVPSGKPLLSVFGDGFARKTIAKFT